MKVNSIFYAAGRDLQNTIRMCIILKEPVEPGALKNAVQKAAVRFPYFCVKFFMCLLYHSGSRKSRYAQIRKKSAYAQIRRSDRPQKSERLPERDRSALRLQEYKQLSGCWSWYIRRFYDIVKY